MNKITYERRKTQGLCVGCGKISPVQGKVMCAKCAEKQKNYRKETREFLRNLGLCPRCGQNKLFGDEKECPECVVMMYEINRKSKEKRNISNTELYKKDITRLKDKGLCRSCRKRKVANGRTYCPICLAKHREQSKEYRRKKEKIGLERSERPNYGLCYTCGKPLDREGRICKKCAEIMTNNFSRNRNNSAWRNSNKLIFENGGRT